MYLKLKKAYFVQVRPSLQTLKKLRYTINYSLQVTYTPLLTFLFYNMHLQNDSLNDKENYTKTKKELLICKNCGFEPVDKFCSNCGQRTQSRFDLKYIVQELFAVFELEKGFLKNIVELTFRPAKMIEEYINGKTKDFYSPFSYFFVSMTIFLFISFNFPISSTFSIGEENDDNSEEIMVFNVKEEENNLKEKYAQKIKSISTQIGIADSLRWKEYLIQNELNDKMLTLQKFREAEIILEKDSLFVIDESKNRDETENQNASIYSSFYTTVSHQLINLQNQREKEVKDLEKKSLSAQIATYTIFYLTPLYLAFIVSLFYSKKKLYFTEHLITQTFIVTQLVVLITCLVGVFRILYWISYFFDKDSTFLQDINIILAALLWFSGFLGIIGYYFFVMRRLYKQSWWLTLLKCTGISIILYFIAFMFFVIVNLIFVG